jgi:hypothetical protein
MVRLSRVGIVGALALVALGSAACANKLVFPASPAVPAADARAKIQLDDNGNAQVTLTVKHLAAPERLFPPRSVYVVWIQPAGEAGTNLGALRPDDDLEGRIVGVTPFTRFRLVITAEDDALVRTPGSQIVLATEQIEAD